ncbi:succinate dehydrogenase, hydrophobic membrane anchor protein [Roseiarcus sp.]|uniref:succinate dehydrogenase, hydrophobic membrane anchor protein n=1 Tax=Roseiarcus sp. TaxID=1969460 RepID=UPI003F952BA0
MSGKAGGLRTPLTRVRFLGSSLKGTSEAWTIHVTGLANVVLGLYFVWLILDLLHMDYNGVRATLGRPIPAILLLAFILSGIVHMEIGMRSIIVDYVDGHPRAWALIANTCFAAILALACVYATLRISFT